MEIQVTKSLPFTTIISALFLFSSLFSHGQAGKGEILKEENTRGYGGPGFHYSFGYESPYSRPGYGNGHGYGFGYESPYFKPGYENGYGHEYGNKPEFGYGYKPRFGYDQSPYFKPGFGYGDGYGFKPEFGHGPGYGYKPSGDLKEDAAASKLKANNGDGATIGAP